MDRIKQNRQTLELQCKDAARASFADLGVKTLHKFMFQLSNHVDQIYYEILELNKKLVVVEKKFKELSKEYREIGDKTNPPCCKKKKKKDPKPKS